MARTVTLGWETDGEPFSAAHLVGLDRFAVERLLVEHPPQARDGKAYWTDAFLDALVAACMGRSEEDLPGLLAEWSEGDWRALTDAAISVSDVTDERDFSSRLEWDQRLREELAYCVPLGVPHSILLGRAWPSPGEPMWLSEDREKALAYARHKTETCVCGTRRAEWAKDRFAFVADMDTCPGCELIEQAQEQVPKEAQGVKLYLIPREVMEARIAAGEDVG